MSNDLSPGIKKYQFKYAKHQKERIPAHKNFERQNHENFLTQTPL